jgi:hypothetical protein
LIRGRETGVPYPVMPWERSGLPAFGAINRQILWRRRISRFMSSDLNFKVSNFERHLFRLLAAHRDSQLNELLTEMVQLWARTYPKEFARAVRIANEKSALDIGTGKTKAKLRKTVEINVESRPD